MARNPNIALITIGYNMYALEDTQSALELMALMSKAVQVDEESYSMRNDTNCTHFLAEQSQLPKLEFVGANKFSPHETAKEAKARFEREKKDREDIDQQFREAPTALEAPTPPDAPIAADEPMFF